MKKKVKIWKLTMSTKNVYYLTEDKYEALMDASSQQVDTTDKDGNEIGVNKAHIVDRKVDSEETYYFNRDRMPRERQLPPPSPEAEKIRKQKAELARSKARAVLEAKGIIPKKS